jgi:hypothetical protein
MFSGRPKAGPGVDVEFIPISIRPKSSPETRLPTWKHYCKMFINIESMFPAGNRVFASNFDGFLIRQADSRPQVLRKVCPGGPVSKWVTISFIGGRVVPRGVRNLGPFPNSSPLATGDELRGGPKFIPESSTWEKLLPIWTRGSFDERTPWTGRRPGG